MNLKPIVVIIALAASANAFAERMGRDSVYATGNGPTATVVKSVTLAGNGRSSVYAKDWAPARGQRSTYAQSAFKPGRA